MLTSMYFDLKFDTGLFRTLGPIHVTDDFKLSSPVQNFTFYTPNLPCHQGLWRRIHQAVRTMPLLDQLIEICGPNPTPLTLLELGMVTLGASTLPTTIIAIGKCNRRTQYMYKTNQ